MTKIKMKHIFLETNYNVVIFKYYDIFAAEMQTQARIPTRIEVQIL